jgi:hypothetical protein
MMSKLSKRANEEEHDRMGTEKGVRARTPATSRLRDTMDTQKFFLLQKVGFVA